MTAQIMAQVKTVPVSKRRITKVGNRYLIYLPMELNELWRLWHENGAVLSMVIEVVEFRKANGSNGNNAESLAQPPTQTLQTTQTPNPKLIIHPLIAYREGLNNPTLIMSMTILMNAGIIPWP